MCLCCACVVPVLCLCCACAVLHACVTCGCAAAAPQCFSVGLSEAVAQLSMGPDYFELLEGATWPATAQFSLHMDVMRTDTLQLVCTTPHTAGVLRIRG